jgi:hypothetical protein
VARQVFEELAKTGIFYQQGKDLVIYDSKSRNNARLVVVPPDRFRSILDTYFEVRKDTRAHPIASGGERATATREDAAMILGSLELQR